MHSSVCPRASDRKSAGIVFRGKYLRGRSTPLLLAQASSARRRGGNYAKNIAQKARTRLPEDAGSWAISGKTSLRKLGFRLMA